MIDKNAPLLEQVYENPFNERIRLLLRLETIFAQAIHHKQANDQYETQLCLDALFALLNLTSRYELRAELLRELERIRSTLLQQLKIDESDSNQVNLTLSELNNCTNILHQLDSKHIDNLRNVEFLNTVKNRNYDRGHFLFELPALQYWLLQPQQQRQEQIQSWLDDFMPLKSAIDFLLHLIRCSAEKEEVMATNGVYIKKVDRRSSTHQLLRIFLPQNVDFYPRVSGDKYRFAVRFMSQNHINQRSLQTNTNIPFIMHTCGI